jgi:hypothetical protein
LHEYSDEQIWEVLIFLFLNWLQSF